MQFLGRRDDFSQPASADARPGQAEEEEEVARPTPKGAGKSGKKGSKRTAKEKALAEQAIEDDEIPF